MIGYVVLVTARDDVGETPSVIGFLKLSQYFPKIGVYDAKDIPVHSMV
jgi:hypothetical protein